MGSAGKEGGLTFTYLGPGGADEQSIWYLLVYDTLFLRSR